MITSLYNFYKLKFSVHSKTNAPKLYSKMHMPTLHFAYHHKMCGDKQSSHPSPCPPLYFLNSAIITEKSPPLPAQKIIFVARVFIKDINVEQLTIGQINDHLKHLVPHRGQCVVDHLGLHLICPHSSFDKRVCITCKLHMNYTHHTQ